MLYAVFGIPVYVLYFLNMGKVNLRSQYKMLTLITCKVLANLFKWVYRKIYYCATRRSRLTRYEVMENSGELEESLAISRPEEELLIPSTACVWVMLFYLSLGTVMFAEWEHWDYLDSLYFCVTSLFKVNKNFVEEFEYLGAIASLILTFLVIQSVMSHLLTSGPRQNVTRHLITSRDF